MLSIMDDKVCMQRALGLALLGGRAVQPNPMVGCVIVRSGRVLSEGWHKQFGKAHAEIEAIKSAKTHLRDATAYVSLEPCAHQGKTAPCTEALITSEIKRVVVACTDLNPKVKGRGILALRSAGIQVEVGLLEKEAQWLNRRFFTYSCQRRPYVVLKWALSSDGLFAPHRKGIHWLSNPQAQQLAHLWRSKETAVLVGYRTALKDNPQLSLRHLSGKQPLRIVIDKKGSLPSSLHIWDTQAPTLSYTTADHKPSPYVQLHPKYFLADMLSDLHKRGRTLTNGGRRCCHNFGLSFRKNFGTKHVLLEEDLLYKKA